MMEKADVVFLSGKFRVIHAGHMRLFRTAIDFGQKLVVALDISELSEEEVLWRKGILENIKITNTNPVFTMIYRGIKGRLPKRVSDIVEIASDSKFF